MAQFQPGNELWKLAGNPGRPRIYATADELWEACKGYFQWVQDNPLQGAELVKYQGRAKVKYAPRMRAMTIDGLTLYLNISRDTWYAWRKVHEFSNIVSEVEKAIYDQKFVGAAAGLLNPNIIARDLGLKDHQELTGADGTDLIPRGDDMELSRRLAYLAHLWPEKSVEEVKH